MLRPLLEARRSLLSRCASAAVVWMVSTALRSATRTMVAEAPTLAARAPEGAAVGAVAATAGRGMPEPDEAISPRKTIIETTRGEVRHGRPTARTRGPPRQQPGGWHHRAAEDRGAPCKAHQENHHGLSRM